MMNGVFNGTELRTWRFLGPIPACCLLQAIFGLIYSTGIFVALVNRPEYTLSVGVSGFSAYLGVTVAGIAMNKFVPPDYEQYASVYASLFGSFGMAAQVLWAYGLSIDDVRLMFFAAALYGTGCGAIYVATVDVLQAWVPEARGRITGIGMFCGASGTLFGIEAFRALTASVGHPVHAIAIVGLLSSALSFVASPFLQKPPAGWHPDLSIVGASLDETSRIVSTSANTELNSKLALKDILGDASLYWLLLAFGATAGPGFGIVLAFQKMAVDMFGVGIHTANFLFFWVTCTGLAGRVIGGLGVDLLDDVGDQHPGLNGAKRTNKLLLIAQLLAVMCVPFFVRAGMLYGFMASSAVIYITFSGGPVVAACLVGGVFDQENASLAFSLITISVGFGDMFFSWLLARASESEAVHRVLQDQLPRAHVNDYKLFLWFSALWSVVGLVATYFVARCKKLRSTEAIGVETERGQQRYSKGPTLSLEGLEIAARRSMDESFLRSHISI